MVWFSRVPNFYKNFYGFCCCCCWKCSKGWTLRKLSFPKNGYEARLFKVFLFQIALSYCWSKKSTSSLSHDLQGFHLHFRWGKAGFRKHQQYVQSNSPEFFRNEDSSWKGYQNQKKKLFWTPSIWQFFAADSTKRKRVGSTHHSSNTYPFLISISVWDIAHFLTVCPKFKEVHRLDGALHIFRFPSLFPQYWKLWHPMEISTIVSESVDGDHSHSQIRWRFGYGAMINQD